MCSKEVDSAVIIRTSQNAVGYKRLKFISIQEGASWYKKAISVVAKFQPMGGKERKEAEYTLPLVFGQNLATCTCLVARKPGKCSFCLCSHVPS